jgi:uncharacterized membrane protein
MNTFFQNYSTIIVFLHVISAVIWVGGMIAIRLTVHPSLQSIENPKIKLGKTLEIVGRLFKLVIPFILILLLTAVTMELGLGLKSATVHIKEAIWTMMTLNFAFMYFKRSKAQKLFDSGNLPAAKEQVKLLPNLLLPINIVLGVIAIVLGVTLRGF